MAAKRKAVRIDDTQRMLEVRSESSSTGAAVAQIPNLLMRANRRQYTQCRAYDFRVKIGLVDEHTEHMYEIFTLSNAWWVKRSIEMAKGVWLANTKKERALLGNKAATYGDFIINTHVGGAGGTDLDLYQYSPAASGDDMTSQLVVHDEDLYDGPREGTDLKDDAGDKMGFTVGAADSTGDGVFNIFDEYLLSRSIVPDADTRTGPYADLFGIDEDALVSLQQDGDQPPWDADAFPSPWVLQDTISVDQGIPSGTKFSRTITAPLGCVIIKKRSADGGEDNFDGNEKILLEVRKGTYKGVHAPAYKAMNGALGN